LCLWSRRRRLRSSDEDPAIIRVISLGAVVRLMIWLWISTIIVLLGAELNAEIEHQTARDSTIGAEKPLRRAWCGHGRYCRSEANVDRHMVERQHARHKTTKCSAIPVSGAAHHEERTLSAPSERRFRLLLRDRGAQWPSACSKIRYCVTIWSLSPVPIASGMFSNRETPRWGLFAPLRIMSPPYLFV